MSPSSRSLHVVAALAVTIVACSGNDVTEQENTGTSSEAITVPHSFRMQRWQTQAGGYASDQKWLAGDFTGDGKTDMANIFCENGAVSIDVHESNGGALINGAARWQTRVGSCTYRRGAFSFPLKWVVGDFNGDRKSDVAGIYKDPASEQLVIDVRVSTGSAFQHYARWQTNGGPWTGILGQFTVGDFNGDGKADIANVFDDGGLATINVHVSRGNQFSLARWQTQGGGYWASQRWMAGDFNGDGLADLANLFDDGGFATIDVHPSNGSAFVGWPRFATKQGGFWSAQQWFVGDFDGDRVADIGKAFDEGGLASIDIHLSSRSNFTMQRWATQQGGFSNSMQWMAGDFQGKGAAVVAKMFDENGWASVDAHVHGNALPPPTNVSVVATSDRTLRIGWTDNGQAESGFRIIRQNGPTKVLPAQSGTGWRVYDDTGLSPNTNYCYSVETFDALGRESSELKCARTYGPPDPAPYSMSVGAAGGGAASIAWYDRSGNDDYYVLERRTGNQPYAQIASMQGPARGGWVSYTDPSLTMNTEYCYRAAAVNAYGRSYTEERCIRLTPPAPVCPNNAIPRSYRFCLVCPGSPGSRSEYELLACSESDAKAWVQSRGVNCAVNAGGC